MLNKYDSAVKLYLGNCKQNCLSEDSIRTYATTFKLYREFLAENKYDEPNVSTTLEWKMSLEDVSICTMDQYLSHLIRLSKFCVTYGIYDTDFATEYLKPPTKKVKMVREKEYKHILSVEQISMLTSAKNVNYGRKSRTFIRDKAIVTLMLLSGPRNIEVRNLTPDDLNWNDNCIELRVTKGGKPRVIPFGMVSQKAVREYLNSGLRPATIPSDAPLFGTLGDSGEWHGLGREQLSKVVYHYTKSILGDDDAARSHAMRHGFASAGIEVGVSLDDLQSVLGHRSTETTLIYAKRLTKNAPSVNVSNKLESVLVSKEVY